MTRQKTLNVALIGQGFMGRTHSNAWGQVGKFFRPPLRPVMHTVFGQAEENPLVFADNWGWGQASTNWEALVRSPEIDLVDVVTPNFMHAPVAKAAIAAGKNVSCEKPIAATLRAAREMAEAAKKAKVKTFVWYNYRRCPAVALAHQLVKRGKVGTIRFVTGQEFTEISGAIAETFIKRRNLMTGIVAGGIAAGLGKSSKKGKVTVDDTVLFLARLSGGAVASFEAARQATGNQNRNGFEINGTKGSLRFNFERMNELEYYDATAERAVQGWTTIIATHAPDHPYVEAWWPDAHGLGYEHGFINMAYDILRALAGRKPVVPIPDFQDAYQTQRVLEAALLSAKKKTAVKLSTVK